MGTFSLKVKREIGKTAPAPKPVAPGPPVLGQAMVEYKSADAAPSAPSKSTKLAKASKAAVDGGLLFVTSPKVTQPCLHSDPSWSLCFLMLCYIFDTLLFCPAGIVQITKSFMVVF